MSTWAVVALSVFLGPSVLLLAFLAASGAWGALRRWRDRRKARPVPGFPRDGKALSQAEHERFLWVTQGYRKSASEPGRKR